MAVSAEGRGNGDRQLVGLSVKRDSLSINSRSSEWLPHKFERTWYAPHRNVCMICRAPIEDPIHGEKTLTEEQIEDASRRYGVGR